MKENTKNLLFINVDENELITAISEQMGQELTEENAVLLKRVFIETEGISVEFAQRK